MSLRLRFTLAFTAVGALVAVLVGVLSFRAASDRVVGGANRTVRMVALAVAEDRDTAHARPDAVTRRSDGNPGSGDDGEQPAIVQSVAPDGTVTHLGGPDMELPVSETGRALAASGAPGQERTTMIDVGGATYCQLTIALGEGQGALQAAIPLAPTLGVLGGMAMEITEAALAVMCAAAGAGWLLARRITRSLVRLAGAAEAISADGHVDREVPVDGRDEVARLSASFNTMTRRLAASRAVRERLVQDAAHEVRTPLTSMTTNAGVLRYVTELSPDDRDRLLDDVEDETRELGHLVDELVELALSRSRDDAEQPVELTEVAGHTARRLHRRAGRIVLLDSDDCVVRGRRQALERAVSNLLENAAKFDGAARIPSRCASVEARSPFPTGDPARGGRGAGVRPVLPGRHRPQHARVRARPGHRPRGGGEARRHRVRAITIRRRGGRGVHRGPFPAPAVPGTGSRGAAGRVARASRRAASGLRAAA